jgi:hypothetical protein
MHLMNTAMFLLVASAAAIVAPLEILLFACCSVASRVCDELGDDGPGRRDAMCGYYVRTLMLAALLCADSEAFPDAVAGVMDMTVCVGSTRQQTNQRHHAPVLHHGHPIAPSSESVPPSTVATIVVRP